jgi:hypothetical protein
MLTVAFTAAEPLTFVATIWFILKTCPDAAALGSNTTADVPDGVR